MHRDTDSSRLIRQSPCNRLTNPPGRICTYLITLCIIKLLNALNKTQIAFLNQIQEAHAASCIALCNADNQAQVCLNQALFCIHITLCFALCKADLLLRAQKRNGTDLFQVHADRIFRADSL